jgi:molecular chaperone DnaK
MAVVGIDLGTTNTVVAAVRDGRAAALKDRLGRALLPSVVSFPPKGEPKIGYEAKHRRTLDPENTVFSIKRLIGRSWDSDHVQTARERFPFELREGPGKATLVRVQGEDHTLPEISALVLTEARKIAEERLGQAVTDCVLTVPANFNDLQRAATKVAGRVAGLQVGRILNEPTAAALAYGFGKKGRERIAVYDFGGGTFDVTLLDLSENVFEVLSTAGDTFLGGDDLDYAIVLRMGEELMKKHRIDMGADTLVREQLRAAAEKIKMDLSTRSMSKVSIEEIGFAAGKAVNFDFSMRRSEFEALAEPFIERTLKVCQEALDVAGVAGKELGEILLVGGSTRIPLVRRRLSSFFGKMPQARINPDEVVAIGAAIQAAALESKLSGGSVPGPPMPGSMRPGTVRSPLPAPDLDSPTTGTTKLGLASAPATLGDMRPPRQKQQTLSGVGAQPGNVHLRQRPKTLLGLGGEAGGETEDDSSEGSTPRTMTGIGQPPTPEELARFAGLSESTGDDADDGPTGRIALSSFDDVTSIIRMPDQVAKLQDREALAREGEQARGASRVTAGNADSPSATEEGSVSFDLAELEASAAAGLDADLPVVQVPGVPVDLDQITEVSGLLEIPEDDDGEADLPVVASQPPLPPPAPKPPNQFAAPFARLNKTMLGTGPAGPDLPIAVARGPGPSLPARASAPLPERPAAGLPDRAAGFPSAPAAFPGAPAALPGARAGVPGSSPSGRSTTPSLQSESGELRLGLAGTQVFPGTASMTGTASLESTAVTGTRSSSMDPGELSDDHLLDADQHDDTGILGSLVPVEGDSTGLPPARQRAPSIDESIDDALVRPSSAPLAKTMLGSVPAPARPPLLIDVTPLALGVETSGGYVDTLIERNSPIPCARTRTFTTARDQQQVVRVRVSQGDAPRFADNTVLGEVELAGIEPRPRGSVRIDVTFSLDESGSLAVSARHQTTGAIANATLRLIGIGER